MNSKEHEALKLALEALEWEYGLNPVGKKTHETITAIKEALAQPEQRSVSEHLEPKCNPHPKAPHGFNRNASHANDRYTCECESWDAYEAGRLDGIAQEQAMYEVQRLGQEIQPEQEPVAWLTETGIVWKSWAEDTDKPLYTHPPVPTTQREPTKQEHDVLIGALKRSSKIVDSGQSKEPEQEPAASKHYYFEYVGFGRWVKCDKETYDKTPEIQRLSVYTTPPQPENEVRGNLSRKPPEAGDGSELFYEAVRLLDNAIFAQSGDVVRHQSAAHREALDFFNHVFTRLDLTPPPQRKPLTDEQIDMALLSFDRDSSFNDIARAIEAAHNIKE